MSWGAGWSSRLRGSPCHSTSRARNSSPSSSSRAHRPTSSPPPTSGGWATRRSTTLVEGDPQIFARNRLVVIVPKTNPARIGGLPDLVRRGTKIVMAAEAVPVGKYSREALHNLAIGAGIPGELRHARAGERRVAGGQRESGGVEGAAGRGRRRNRVPLGRHAGRRRGTCARSTFQTSTMCWPATPSRW